MTKSGLAISLALFAMLTACESAGSSAASDDLADKIGEAMKSFETDRGFSGALIVEANGEPVMEAGYGYADRENEIPFTIDTVAQIGSLTKQFTAIAALTLADEGLLHLYQPIKTYLPEAPEQAARITLHQLMTHSSGMPEYCGKGDFIPLSRDEVVSNCLSQPLLFEPGTRSEYSNPGYSVVAAIIERVTGKSLEEILQEKIFAPNGLNTAGYRYNGRDDLSFAYGYDGDEKQPVISDSIDELGKDWWMLKGNGGIQASANDMRRWYHVLRGEGAIKSQTLKAFMTSRYPEDARTHVAYGWYVFFDNDGEILQVSHSGSDGVFYSYFWQNPRNDFFFYLVGNAGEEVSRDAVRAVRSILFEAGDGPPS